MHSIDSLRHQVQGLNGKDYAAYQSLRGSYTYNGFRLHVDQIPKDPYAPPGTGIFRVVVGRSDAGLAETLPSSIVGRVALRDYLARQFHRACQHHCPGRRGTGNSGLITIAEPGQQVLERTSVQLVDEGLEVRFFLGLPASGRTVDAGTAQTMLFQELPEIVQSALFAASLDLDALQKHVDTSEDAEYLRNQLSPLGLVAFIADDSILPRASGVDMRPLQGETVVPFRSPNSLRVSIELPHAGRVTGMGIPKGVTLIVGGGYHGKSTLLQALELGIYNHIPGDGRELCASLPTAAKVRAASGRSVVNADISAFINDLPLQHDTRSFSTDNASGSTSQAAFITESIEAGAGLLLMDEDTCATNFMIRDGLMQQLVHRKHEPITAFVDRVRPLYQDLGISTILVMGGCGDYFGVADCVIQMTGFEPKDVTEHARAIVQNSPSQRTREGGVGLGRPEARVLDGRTLDPKNEYGHFRVSAADAHHLVFGQSQIDLSDVDQLTEAAQTRAIGQAIEYAKRYMDGRSTLREVTDKVMADLDSNGLDVLDQKHTGDLSSFRGLDLAAALNRIRGLGAWQER